MAIRQIVSRSIKDGTIVDADAQFICFSTGSGFFKEKMVHTLQYIKVRVTSFV